jgi:hypothetical protein
MAVVGGYLLLKQVQVTTAFWNFGRYGGFGLTLLPLLAGVAFLFYDGKSAIGWLLTVLGTAIILASFGAPATTRNWNTLNAIVRVLESPS